jgi:hypothetical protein
LARTTRHEKFTDAQGNSALRNTKTTAVPHRPIRNAPTIFQEAASTNWKIFCAAEEMLQQECDPNKGGSVQ